MVAKSFRIMSIPIPLCWPDLVPADFFRLPNINKRLADKILAGKIFEILWEETVRMIAKKDLTAAFPRWYERCKKQVCP